MPVFENAQIFEEVLTGFFNLVGATPEVANKLIASRIVVRFNYGEPDVVILVDCSQGKVDVRPGDTETDAIVEMTMAADLAHRFWFGKVNLTKALTRREIVAKGPIPRILKLLPAIKPTYAMYPTYLEESGYGRYNLYR